MGYHPCDLQDIRKSIWLCEIKVNFTTPRALCAVESLATQMPGWCVRFLLVDFRDEDSRNVVARKLLRMLPDVRITGLYPEAVLAETPPLDLTGPTVKKSKVCGQLKQLFTIRCDVKIRWHFRTP